MEKDQQGSTMVDDEGDTRKYLFMIFRPICEIPLETELIFWV
jgi:hypothetical protein